MAPTWVVGATVNLLGSILINLGTNLMKLGHNKSLALEELERNNAPASPSSSSAVALPPASSSLGGKDNGNGSSKHHLGRTAVPRPKKKPRPARSFREWQAGIALFAGGNVFNFVSFGFAAQSLLAALGSVQFVSNVVFARLVLKEAVTWRVLGATALIVTGCILLVTFGNHGSELLSAKMLVEAYANPAYIAYLVLAFFGVAVAYCLYRHGKAAALDPRRSAASRSRWHRSLPVSYALFSGLLGTQSVLFCKALSTLLRTTLHGRSQLGSWFFWVSLLALVLTALFWVSRLNKGLRLFPAVVIVPTMQISWTLFSIVSGMVYYKEYRSFSTLSAAMFALGVALVFVGVWLLTPAAVAASSAVGGGAGAVDSEGKEVDGDGGSGGEAATAGARRAAAAGDGGGENVSDAAAAAAAAAVVPVFEDDGISVEPLVASSADGEEDEDGEELGGGVRSDDGGDGGDKETRRRTRRRESAKGASPSSSSSVPPLDLGGVGAAAAAAASAGGKGTPRSPFANEHWRQQRAAAAAAAAASSPPAADAAAAATTPGGQSPPPRSVRAQLQQAFSPASSAGASYNSAPAATAEGSSPSRWEDIALGSAGEGGGGSEAAAAAAPAAAAAAAPAPRPSSSSRVRRRTCNSFMDDLANDFSVDAPSSLRPLLGLGPPGGAMAAVSLFSVPYEGLLPRGGGGAVGGGTGSVTSIRSLDDQLNPRLRNNPPSSSVPGSRLASSSSKHRHRRDQQQQPREVQLPGEQQGQQLQQQQRQQQQRQLRGQGLQNRWSAPGDVESAGGSGGTAAAVAMRDQQQLQQLQPGAGVRITEGEEEDEGEGDPPAASSSLSRPPPSRPASPPLSARAAASALARPVAAAAARVARGVAAGAARVASPASDRPRPTSDDGGEDLEALPPPASAAAAQKSVELPKR